MDAFGFAVGFAGIDPRYFWCDMDFCELSALVPAYREPWEQTRIIVQALTGEFIPMPWDAELKAKQQEKLAAELEATNKLRNKRLAAAKSLEKMNKQ